MFTKPIASLAKCGGDSGDGDGTDSGDSGDISPNNNNNNNDDDDDDNNDNNNEKYLACVKFKWNENSAGQCDKYCVVYM